MGVSDGVSVGFRVGFTVGCKVVGNGVGCSVGVKVGHPVGSGSSVGKGVGRPVGNILFVSVGNGMVGLLGLDVCSGSGGLVTRGVGVNVISTPTVGVLQNIHANKVSEFV